ncbi:Sjoegren syndrome nuclear autoantigen 1 [Blattella germanica]|nr:Sjoegren syndrome nuclear autoantigen 1 [Blattella germanica]
MAAAQQGAALQTYNQELIKSIEELKQKRRDLQTLIEQQEEEKASVQRDIEKLSSKVAQINESLAKKIAIRNDYDHTIAESEAAYSKILESSQVLLSMVRREAMCLEQNTVKKIGPAEGGEM